MKQLRTETLAVKVTPSERLAFDRFCRKEHTNNQSVILRG